MGSATESLPGFSHVILTTAFVPAKDKRFPKFIALNFLQGTNIEQMS